MSNKSSRKHPASPAGEPPGIRVDTRELITLLPPMFYAMRASAPAPALHQLVRPLGPRHFPALMLIAALQPLTVGELARRLRFNLATTSQLVADLDRAGLVSRSQDLADRRRTLVEVSAENAAAVHDWYAGRAEPLQRALDRLTEPERRSLITSLTIILEELTAAQEGVR